MEQSRHSRAKAMGCERTAGERHRTFPSQEELRETVICGARSEKCARQATKETRTQEAEVMACSDY